ncbi:MAG: diphosphate--fructose-6-phosphate 1-phosphotransferase [Polyangia bacterium]|jgi:6-phosphofructokinase 1|nr:diphosphate--fructose-6-phosphate 1-phosphotransferase [Polyangia bacterium]
MAESTFQHGNRGETLGILVGGGPAPGINGVIRSATIEATNHGMRVVGIMDGFKWLARGDNSKITRLDISQVSRIHFRGGSILRTSRVNPTSSQEMMDNAVRALRNLEIDYLITIGGDDTAYSAMRIDEATGDWLHVAHVPKTIDNDLPLPGRASTFGYQTARHVGVGIIQNIMTDAATTSRWYFIIAMGRKAGHLALGIGRAASATVSLIPEEFRGKKVPLSHIADILEGAIIKRRSMGKDYGTAVIAEGLAEVVQPEDLAELDGVERDDHGHIRYSEIPFGRILQQQVRKRLKARGIDTTIVNKNIGYELRCADPIPFDQEYTQDLGYAAMAFLSQGKTSSMISLQGGQVIPVPLKEMLDPETGRTQVRLVNVDSDSYLVARHYMIRLNQDDFSDPGRLGRLARAGHMQPQEFQDRFSYLAQPIS